MARSHFGVIISPLVPTLARSMGLNVIHRAFFLKWTVLALARISHKADFTISIDFVNLASCV